VKLEANGVGGEGAAGQPCPLDRARALFDPSFARAALIVEGDVLGRAPVMLVTMKPTRG
jgi:hypothetical protein